MGRSKLKTALKAEKGIDIKKLKEKRRLKKLAKLKAKKSGARAGAATKKIPEEDEHEDEEDEYESEDEDYTAELDEDEDDEDSEEEEEEEEEEEDEEEHQIDLAALDESSDDSSVDFEEKIERPKKPKQQTNGVIAAAAPSPKNSKQQQKKNKAAEAESSDGDEEEEEEEEDEEDEEIDWADLPPEEREDLVPRTRISINNTAGLLAALKRFAIPTDESTVPFSSHQSLSSATPTADAIGEDGLQDDIKRELAFYAQALDAGRRGRALLKKEGVPFSRPTDYFAEMVKDDGHMDKVKAKMVEEASAKKASAEARKLRELKKFGKQVQVAKLQERAKEKRETLEKIKNLKRKRSETGGADLGTQEADLFDVAVDNELKSHKPQQSRAGSGAHNNNKRQKKNEKYGFGGKKKHAKSGDAVSSGDLSGFSAKRMKANGPGAKAKLPKTSRLGKSRRKAGAGKR
ncbi:eukaryotic rRNA processing protein EBP2-domain-containing protein [Xylariaceae sp. FL0594]|nr:eukaryotic rRNA processing protein EBP2-domain-containing protein [Xylariaceae sp. FL0594]